jgi:hypothetical protein
MTNPSFHNLTTGEVLQWTGLVLGAGDVLRIDHGNGSITLNGVGGQHLTGLDIVNSDFWDLIQGDNLISLIPFSAGDGASAQIFWRDAF